MLIAAFTATLVAVLTATFWKPISLFFIRTAFRLHFYWIRRSLDINKYRFVPGLFVPDVILSLTTSPSRLVTSLPKVLAVFAPQVKTVELNLPLLYRNQLEYSKDAIEAVINQFPNVQVFRQENDFGPVLKLLPTAARHRGEDVVIVTLDDDCLPPTVIVRELAQKCRQTQGAVCCSLRNIDRIPIVFGSMGNAFPAWKLEDSFIHTLERYAQASAACRTHDDLTIGAALYQCNIPVVELTGHGSIPYALDEGADTNALWYTDIFHDKDKTCYGALQNWIR